MTDAPHNPADMLPKARPRFPALFWLVLSSLAFSSATVGLMVWLPRLQRQRAIEEIDRLGGVVYTRPSSAHWGERILDEICGQSEQRVVFVDLTTAMVNDETMEIFASFPDVRLIMIGGEQLTDDGLRKLKGNTRLQRLTLVNCPKVSENVLKELQKEIPGLRIFRRGPALLGVTGKKDRRARGCRIFHVRNGTAAARGGILRGDVITAINRKRVTDFESLAAELAGFRPGQKITVTLIRHGRRRTLPITLGSWSRSVY